MLVCFFKLYSTCFHVGVQILYSRLRKCRLQNDFRNLNYSFQSLYYIWWLSLQTLERAKKSPYPKSHICFIICGILSLTTTQTQLKSASFRRISVVLTHFVARNNICLLRSGLLVPCHLFSILKFSQNL